MVLPWWGWAPPTSAPESITAPRFPAAPHNFTSLNKSAYAVSPFVSLEGWNDLIARVSGFA